MREEFLQVVDVKLQLRVPEGRSVPSVSLLRSGDTLPADALAGWLDITVPRVWTHEAVLVDLA